MNNFKRKHGLIHAAFITREDSINTTNTQKTVRDKRHQKENYRKIRENSRTKPLENIVPDQTKLPGSVSAKEMLLKASVKTTEILA